MSKACPAQSRANSTSQLISCTYVIYGSPLLEYRQGAAFIPLCILEESPMSLIKKIGVFQFTTTGIRVCGMLFLLAGAFGAVIQTGILGVGNMTNNQLMLALEQDPSLMQKVTLSLILQALGSSALPIFARLLVEGGINTSHFGKYFLRVLGLAVITQLPYNLVMTGNFMATSALNPVFALVMCLIMLYFFRRYEEKKFTNTMMKLLAVFCVFMWTGILGIDHGQCCVLLVAELWALREKANLQTFVGILLMFGCMIFSVFYLLAPVGFLILHFYEGEKGSENRLVNYLAYPVILLICGLMGIML